jgi:hypothetical protein
LPRTAFGYFYNRFYVDAGFSVEGLVGGRLDLRLSGRNLFNNTDRVAAQFRRETYTPRGAGGELTVNYRF